MAHLDPFPAGYSDWYKPEENQRAKWPKCDNNNNDEDNSPNKNNVKFIKNLC